MTHQIFHADPTHQIPDPECLVKTGRDGVAPIGGHRDGGDRLGVSSKGTKTSAVIDVPDAQSLVLAEGYSAVPVGCDGHVENPMLVAAEHVEAVTGVEIPHAHRVVIARGDRAYT